MFRFDRARGRFRLQSVHPGHTVDEVVANTGFDVRSAGGGARDARARRPQTLALIRGRVGATIAETYPRFAAEVLAIGTSARPAAVV